MSAAPARAGYDWLTLREPADAAARATELVDELRALLPVGPLRIHDLGCGTGSMARWLAPRLPHPQHWVLHDRDADLLARVALPVTHEIRRDDITRLDPADLADADLVTASALLDMMTAVELGRFVDLCSAPGCPVLVTLTVVGRVELTPPDPLDAEVGDAFNAHQRRDRGDGNLLGPDAVAAARQAFEARGREVVVRPSPWLLGPQQAAVTEEWLTGWRGAALEQRPALAPATADYARRRLAAAAAGALSVTVHHEDLLVRPAVRGSRS
jgi:SAM-dependent methyltransferase